MTQQKIGDVSFHYEIVGNGPKLVMIGGLNCHIDFWDLIKQDLCQDFRLLMFDNHGIGKSRAPDNSYTIEDMADETLELMKLLGFSHAHILGSSLGSAVALSMARKYESMLGKIVLCNTFIELRPKTRALIHAIMKLTQKIPFELLMEISVPWLFADRTIVEQQLIQSYRSAQTKHPLSPGVLHQTEALLKFSCRDWYEQVRCETMIIHGEEDLFCPIGDALAMAEGMPNAAFEPFTNAAHMTHLEAPEHFVRLLKGFLLS
jgi:pimeloyl-ACP methyl ester carboxylesterase